MDSTEMSERFLLWCLALSCFALVSDCRRGSSGGGRGGGTYVYTGGAAPGYTGGSDDKGGKRDYTAMSVILGVLFFFLALLLLLIAKKRYGWKSPCDSACYKCCTSCTEFCSNCDGEDTREVDYDPHSAIPMGAHFPRAGRAVAHDRPPRSAQAAQNRSGLPAPWAPDLPAGLTSQAVTPGTGQTMGANGASLGARPPSYRTCMLESRTGESPPNLQVISANENSDTVGRSQVTNDFRTRPTERSIRPLPSEEIQPPSYESIMHGNET